MPASVARRARLVARAAVARMLNGQRGLERLALDLHDGPLQDLTAVGFTISQLQRTLENVEGDASQAIRELADVQQQLVTIEATLRRIAATQDSAADSSTVIELIEKEILRFKSRSDAAVEIRIVGDVEPETASQRIVIHRVLRESLSNAASHSQAKNVRITVEAIDDTIRLSVSDDGVGFDADARLQDGRVRLGVPGMQRRLELLEGSLSVISKIGGPTCVTATIKRWRPGEYPPTGA
jgi:signal transduction histidine kinase